MSNPATVLGDIEPAESPEKSLLASDYAVLAPDTPSLRLSSPGWITLTVEHMAEVASTDDLFQLCQERLAGRTSPFSKPVRLFLQRYFEFAGTHLESGRAELRETLDQHPLLTYRDWIFSAWLPLPQAHVLLPPGFEDEGPGFCEFDIVFWLEGRLLAVTIDGTATPLKSRRRKIDFLRDNHPRFELIQIPKDQLEDGPFPVDLFPEYFPAYWRNIRLPQGPNPPATLAVKF